MWADRPDQIRRQKSLWLGLPRSGSLECELPQAPDPAVARSECEDRQQVAAGLSKQAPPQKKKKKSQPSPSPRPAGVAAFSWVSTPPRALPWPPARPHPPTPD